MTTVGDTRRLPSLEDVAAAAGTPVSSLALRHLYVGPGALGQAPRLVGELAADRRGDVVVLADNVPYAGPNGEVKRSLLDSLAERGAMRLVTLRSGADRVHADAATLDAASRDVGPAAVLVTVGSGTLADIGKVVAERHDLPHLVVQTAASVNGFTDDQSVLLVSGAKRTTPSRWPDALIADTDVIAAAPRELNRAGVGDLLSMFTAPADWLLADAVGLGRPYNPALVDLVRPHGPRLLEIAARLDERRPEDLADLARLLSISGLTMGLAGATAPSSGTEHVISHLLEMRLTASGREAAWHGQQVGVATLVAATVWRRLRATVGEGPLPALSLPDEDHARERVLRVFAPLGEATAQECWRAYASKLATLAREPARLADLRRRWPALQPSLDALLAAPADLVEAMRSAGAAVRFSQLGEGYDPSTVTWAVANGHRMRDRFTVTDLAELLGLWNNGDVDSVLDELDGLGAGR
ncbi:iron-containing alcohol dehydrogenase [Streptomyces sp. NPDC014864]|uniref:iron-containing alcohol dehydrogenase n=1 Tax=Streptomyces sp. NPDC014864 TaxID=3364924 RepID=UPI0036F6ED79